MCRITLSQHKASRKMNTIQIHCSYTGILLVSYLVLRLPVLSVDHVPHALFPYRSNIGRNRQTPSGVCQKFEVKILTGTTQAVQPTLPM